MILTIIIIHEIIDLINLPYISYTLAKRDDEDKYIDEEDVDTDSNTFRADQVAPRLKRKQNSFKILFELWSQSFMISTTSIWICISSSSSVYLSSSSLLVGVYIGSNNWLADSYTNNSLQITLITLRMT